VETRIGIICRRDSNSERWLIVMSLELKIKEIERIVIRILRPRLSCI